MRFTRKYSMNSKNCQFFEKLSVHEKRFADLYSTHKNVQETRIGCYKSQKNDKICKHCK